MHIYIYDRNDLQTLVTTVQHLALRVVPFEKSSWIPFTADSCGGADAGSAGSAGVWGSSGFSAISDLAGLVGEGTVTTGVGTGT